jgi:crotonobetainyl-CoA:carnitine CoA-transferase CaiB-like acyl-CoA transferase
MTSRLAVAQTPHHLAHVTGMRARAWPLLPTGWPVVHVIKIECHGSGDDTRGCGPPCLPQTDGSGSAETAYDLDRPLNPALQRVASPLKLTATPVVAQHALPLLDKHTREVLSDVRGLSTAHIDALAQACVV